MSMPPETQLRVAHIDVLLDRPFNRSISHWRFPSESESRWSRVGNQTRPILIGEHDALEIDGDSDALISAPDGGVLHINGDLNAGLETGGFQEILIRGDVSREAKIHADGFFHLYIGGSMNGEITTTDSSKIWVDGDFRGSISTGNPSTRLYVDGDFDGTVSAHDSPSLFFLCVKGFARHESIRSISSIGYTLFNASVGVSDVPAGLYPDGPERRVTKKGNSYSRWCVLQQQ
ncbi:hypothetical protein [Rhodopirellula europaea]|uniref:hypothetical protein n=1 Tax=Rhodopirellula europaea TaxID=1263866 RepID=UPI003D29FDCC